MAKRRPKRAALAGVWLTVVPDILNGTTLSPEKFWDNLHLRFGLELLGIRNRCDGWGEKIRVKFALQCRKCGLVVAHHNDVADEWGALFAASLNPKADSH